MNRRGFLKSVGLAIGATIVGISAIQKSPVPKRKLKACWTCDLEQDLQAFHGLDVETELANKISKEVQKEIDNEIINIMFEKTRIG